MMLSTSSVLRLQNNVYILYIYINETLRSSITCTYAIFHSVNISFRFAAAVAIYTMPFLIVRRSKR